MLGPRRSGSFTAARRLWTVAVAAFVALLPLALALLPGLLPSAPQAGAADLPAYFSAQDDSYAWERAGAYDTPTGVHVVVLRLTSQTWQGIRWQHWLTLLRPAELRHPEHALLVISGGSLKKDPPLVPGKELLGLAEVARSVGTRVCILGQVPNQPLFDNLKEDNLIAFTFAKYFETGDATWPCLLPMTRSAVRAMDAAQEFAAQEGGPRPEKFFVTGASKRGWTTWLTAAADARVSGIAPMVIDTLNFARQMPLSRLSFGGYSEQIEEYTKRGIQDRFEEPAGRRLLELVDPYSYRDRLTMPKLILLGTNDRYWPVDAARMYFDDLPGEKYLSYLPNAGHGLGPQVVPMIASFYAMVIGGVPRPRFSWRTAEADGARVATVEAGEAPASAELWRAVSSDRDFRDERWTGAALTAEPSAAGEGAGEGAGGGAAGARFVARVPLPTQGFAAWHVTLGWKSALGVELRLSTPVEVLGGTPEDAGAGGEGGGV
ncbi:MAG: hypothetical protein HZA54_20320, partial [Planctomycetes bacterium]|nr:hypothetical protein [Planctomycetota bacterium]